MWELELRTGDRLLLCSDGLTNEVGSDEMAGILGEVDDPGEAAQRLVDVANGHGGADNITVVVVDVQVGEEGDGARLEGDAARPRRRRRRRPPAADGRRPGGASRRRRHGRSPTPDAGASPSRRPAPDAGRPTAGLSDATAVVPAVGLDETLAPGSRLVFGDEPTHAGRDRARAATSSSWAPTASVPVARSTTRVAAARRQPGGRQAGGEGEPGRPPAPPGHPAPHHAAGDRLRHSGGRRAGGGLLRPQVVRLRQLDRDGAGRRRSW